MAKHLVKQFDDYLALFYFIYYL